MSFDIVSFLMGQKAGGGGGGGGGGGDPALPAEYQRVEYLANDGNCWCEINGTIKKWDVIEIVVSLSSSASSGENGICGANQVWEIYVSNNKIQTWGSPESVQLSIERDVKTTFSTLFSTANGMPTSFLWGRYTSGNYPYKGNMYALRIYRGWGSAEEKLINLVPCYRKADSVPGFYDLSNSAFYSNAGTGTFGIGPDVN